MTVHVTLADGREIEVGHIGRIEAREPEIQQDPRVLVLHFDDYDHQPQEIAGWTALRVGDPS